MLDGVGEVHLNLFFGENLALMSVLTRFNSNMCVRETSTVVSLDVVRILL
jgi:hypothetical protein